MGKSLKGKDLGKGITQRKDGSYQATYVDRFGKRRYIYDSSLRSIKKKLIEERSKDNLKLNDTKCNVKIDQLYEEWISLKKNDLRGATITFYNAVYKNHIHKKIGNVRVNKVKVSDIVALYDGIRDYSAGLCGATRTIVSSMYDYAVQVGYVDRNMFASIPLKSHQIPKKTECLNEEQVKIFLDYAGIYQVKYLNLFKLVLATGMRSGECFGLCLEDIHEDHLDVNSQMIYESGKGHKLSNLKTQTSKRKIPLNNMAKEAIVNELKFRTETDSNLLFINARGNCVTSSSANSALRRLYEEIVKKYPDFPKLHMHMLRHTFATLLFKKGVNPKVIQSYLGHKSVMVTLDVYVTQDFDKESINSLNNVYK